MKLKTFSLALALWFFSCAAYAADGSLLENGRLKQDVLVFNANDTGNHEIYAVHNDGARLMRLTSDARYDSWWARISPARDKILFYRSPKGVHDSDLGKNALWVMNADGTDQRLLRQPGQDGWQGQAHAEWSPDGSKMVMLGGKKMNLQIFTTDAEGKNPHLVTRRGGANIDPSWSPDGSHILFIGCPTFICFEKDYEVYLIRAEGGNATRLTHDDITDNDPYYSPDGKNIAWLSKTDPRGFGGAGVWQIRAMSEGGTGPYIVTRDKVISSKPQWAPDSDVIYYHRFAPGKDKGFRLYAIHRDGTGMTEIHTGLSRSQEYPGN